MVICGTATCGSPSPASPAGSCRVPPITSSITPPIPPISIRTSALRSLFGTGRSARSWSRRRLVNPSFLASPARRRFGRRSPPSSSLAGALAAMRWGSSKESLAVATPQAALKRRPDCRFPSAANFPILLIDPSIRRRFRAGRKVRPPARRAAGAHRHGPMEPGGLVRPPSRPPRRLDGDGLAGAPWRGLDLDRRPDRMAKRAPRQPARLRRVIARGGAPGDDCNLRLHRLGDDDDHRRRHGDLRHAAFRCGGNRLPHQSRAGLGPHPRGLGRGAHRHHHHGGERARFRTSPGAGAIDADDARLCRHDRLAAPPAGCLDHRRQLPWRHRIWNLRARQFAPSNHQPARLRGPVRLRPDYDRPRFRPLHGGGQVHSLRGSGPHQPLGCCARARVGVYRLRREPGLGDHHRRRDRARSRNLADSAGVEATTGSLSVEGGSMDGERFALVTGAGSGVGKASALALARTGWHVALAGRRRELLEEVAGEIKAFGRRALPVATDVGDPEAVKALFAQIEREFGRLDLLFNNAGQNAPPVPIDELTFAQWSAVVGVNLNGMFLCAQGAFGLMKRQEPQGGRIINNGSISAHTPRPLSIAYNATKHAVSGMTKSIALDGRPHDIACGQIDIGNALTEMARKQTLGVRQADGRIAPEPTMDVTEVGEAVAHMANLPLSTNVLTMTIMATKMPFVGRG